MSASSGPAPGGGVPAARRAPILGWRVFPGEDRQLRTLRQWLVTMLPDCQERHDVLAVATELASNAVKHTASGRGGTFAVALLSGGRMMRVAVADGGAESGPRMNENPAGEHGRGLLIVRGLAARTGASGDEHGRLVWAEIPWPVSCTVTALPTADQAQELLAPHGLVPA
ncbi:MAG TPA: ATP-binding protein [Streptosporangiaceae bacterium]|jgi:anti-sigma regulatory factor (Ser/Thr protein kinase)